MDHPTSSGLTPLTRDRAHASLIEILGDDEGRRTWNEICSRAQLEPDSPLELDELELLADELMDCQGAISIVGSSLAIRIRTYRMLEGVSRLGDFVDSGAMSNGDGYGHGAMA